MAEKAKFYQKTKTIGGVEYTAQYSGLRPAIQMADNCYVDGTSNYSAEKMNDYVLRHFIVKPPGLTIDDFDDLETLNAVVEFGREVAQNTFQEKEIAE